MHLASWYGRCTPLSGPTTLNPHPPLTPPLQVYAFGILMWEMYTAQRPYGNMKQQQLVEEVRGGGREV